MQEDYSVREVAVISLNDECVEQRWRGDDENGNENEEGAGRDKYTIHGLLQMGQPSKNHGNAGNEDEIKHNAPHQTIFDNVLAEPIDIAIIIAAFEYIGIDAVLVEEGNVNGNFYYCVAYGVGNKAVERLRFAAEAMQRHMNKVSERNGGQEPKHKVHRTIRCIVKPLMRRVGHVSPHDQRGNEQHAEIHHDNINAEN